MKTVNEIKKLNGSKKGILSKILEKIKSILDCFNGTTSGYDVDDENIWGATQGSVYFSGLIEQMDADSDVIDVTANVSIITADNVIDELGKVYNKIPATIENDPDLVWLISSDIAKAYKQAQAAQISTGNIVGDKVLDYLGHEMITTDELPAKTMIVYRKSNLGDGNVSVYMNLYIGVDYPLRSEIVYYS